MRLRLCAALGAFCAGVAAIVIAVLLLAPIARADGDPASDYLLTPEQPAFTGYDNKVSKAEADALTSMLLAARAKGFPLKVAVIPTRYDMGAVPVLYKKPQTYAKFLGQEIYFVVKDEVLVVMPNGYGVYKAKGTPPADVKLLARLPRLNTTDGNELVHAAQVAVQRLAASRGITLAVGSGSAGGGTSVWRERGEIAGAAILIGLLALGGRFLWRRRA
jgi:hypothetical protein